MKTELPQNLIEVAYHSTGKPRSAFASCEALERRKAGGCVGLYKPTGQPMKDRWPGDFEWHHAMLNVGNIMEMGAPRLSAGWRERVEQKHAQFWAEFSEQCRTGGTP